MRVSANQYDYSCLPPTEATEFHKSLIFRFFATNNMTFTFLRGRVLRAVNVHSIEGVENRYMNELTFFWPTFYLTYLLTNSAFVQSRILLTSHQASCVGFRQYFFY